MQISADPDHPAFSQFASSALILFNGEPRRDVVFADEATGEIEYYVYPLTRGAEGTLVTKRAVGKVAIYFMGQ